MNPSQALSRAIRDLLRAELPLRIGHCGEHEDHRPPARSGQYYVSVFPTEYSLGGNSEAQLVLDRLIGVSLGITQRTGVVPSDRMIGEMQKEHGVLGLYTLIDALMRDKRLYLLKCAQMLLGDKWAGQFVEPLKRRSGTLQVRQAGPDHFRAPPCKDGAKCTDYGAYLVLPFTGARYMQSLQGGLPATAGAGVGYWVIEQDFVVGGEPDSDEWTAYIDNALVNARSGGYGGFSGDSQYLAVRVGVGDNWQIHGRSTAPIVITHDTHGSTMQDFMWSRDSDYFWLDGDGLQLRSVNGAMVNEWTLPTAIDGKTVQWRAGTGSNGEKQFIIGSHDAGGDVYHHYIQSIDRMGPQEGYWVLDLAGRTETRWHNVFLRDGFGQGGSLSSADASVQDDVYTVDYDGTNLVQQFATGVSHECFKGNEMLYFESANDGLELKNLSTGNVTHVITQQQLKDAAGITEFVAGGHADLRGNGAVISGHEIATNNWYVFYWDRTEVTRIHGPFYCPRPTDGTFADSVLPTLSPNNRYVALQDAGGVRIVTV